MKKKNVKRNQGYDYSDIQELSIEVMRRFPKEKGHHFNKDGNSYKWNAKAEKLCDEADQRIARGTWNKPAHQALKHKLIKALI